MLLRWFFIIQLIFSPSIIWAQSSTYPKYYFRNPLGIPIELTANFGELRSDHWHMGLDIRTNQKENLPVYASAEGYIAHAGVRPQSFGRYLIINHPNGYSTLYAHLNDFFQPLEKFVREQQYQQESWEIELDLTKEQFPVFKSQFIAYSGNTGGSQGPHLHFEIRNTKTDKCLNPLLFGLPLKDDVPPNFVKLAMYNRNKSVYDQTPEFFPVKNISGGYVLSQTPVIKTGYANQSFAIQVFDRVTGSKNPNGINSARLFLDEEPLTGFTLDSIGYNETLYINAHIDYKYRFDGGAYLQHLTALPGDNGMAYRKIKDEGTILLRDTLVHNVRIEIKDAYFNTSQLKFGIQYNDSLGKSAFNINGNPGVPRFVPNNVNVMEKPDFEMYLPENSLYDTITVFYFRTNSASPFSVSAMHQLNDPSFPLHEDMTIRIKPDKPIPEEWKDKIVIQRNYRGSSSVRKAEWQGNALLNEQWLAAKFGDFGIFQAFADTEPPVIDELGKVQVDEGDTIDLSKSNSIVFQPTDNFKVIKNFRAELDGKWLCFTNDKKNSWIYIFDEHCPYGSHELKVTVEDLVGNSTSRTWLFKRYPVVEPKKKVVMKKSSTKKKTIKKQH